MNRESLVAVLKGAAIALLPALLVFLVDAASSGALGPYGLALAPVLSILLNLVRKMVFPDKPTPGPDATPDPNPIPPDGVLKPEGLLNPDGLLGKLLTLLLGGGKVKPDAPAPNPPPLPAPEVLPLVKPDDPDKGPPGPWVAAILAVLLLGGNAMAELKITGELKVPAYRLAKLSATGDLEGAALIWDISPEEQADVLEVPGGVVLVGPPGAYRVKLRAFRSKDGKLSAETARATLTIGDAPPPPVPPVPPVPPGPESQLVKDLRAAYQADPGSLKGQQVASLAAVYREVAGKTNSADLKTAGDLLSVLRTAVASLVPPDALVGLRKRIGTELSSSLPTDPAAVLDSVTRQKAAEVFGRVASALEVIK